MLIFTTYAMHGLKSIGYAVTLAITECCLKWKNTLHAEQYSATFFAKYIAATGAEVLAIIACHPIWLELDSITSPD